MTPSRPDPGTLTAELRAAAHEYVAHGWPVVPGTSRLWGCPGAALPRPDPGEWARQPVTTAEQVTTIWAEEPYSILLRCGESIDSVAVAAREVPRASRLLRNAACTLPTIVTPFHSRHLLVHSGPLSEPPPPGVQYHGTGTSVVLPPCGRHPRDYWWYPNPADRSWDLPEAADVLRILRGQNWEPPPSTTSSAPVV